MASKRLQGQKQFHSKNYHLEMPRFDAKICLKSAPQMTKSMSKGCTLNCSCKYHCAFQHSQAE